MYFILTDRGPRFLPYALHFPVFRQTGSNVIFVCFWWQISYPNLFDTQYRYLYRYLCLAPRFHACIPFVLRWLVLFCSCFALRWIWCRHVSWPHLSESCISPPVSAGIHISIREFERRWYLGFVGRSNRLWFSSFLPFALVYRLSTVSEGYTNVHFHSAFTAHWNSLTTPFTTLRQTRPHRSTA